MNNQKIAGSSLLLGVLSLVFIFAIIPLVVRMETTSFMSGLTALTGFLIAIAGLLMGIWSSIQSIKNKRMGLVLAICGVATSSISLIIFAYLIIAVINFS